MLFSLNNSCILWNLVRFHNIVLLSCVKLTKVLTCHIVHVMPIKFLWCCTLFHFLHSYGCKMMWCIADDRCWMKSFVFSPHTLVSYLLLPSWGFCDVLKCIKYVIDCSLCMSWRQICGSGHITAFVNCSTIRKWVVRFVSLQILLAPLNKGWYGL
jgi:hypothetical protein